MQMEFVTVIDGIKVTVRQLPPAAEKAKRQQAAVQDILVKVRARKATASK